MKLYIVIPDIHDTPPNKKSLKNKAYHPALRCVENVAKAYSPCGAIYLGDLVEMASLSAFDENKSGLMEGRRFSQEMDSANHLLNRHQAIFNEMDYCEGNHEHRITRYLEKHPEQKGNMELEEKLLLKFRKINFIPYGRVLKKGKALFTHGHTASTGHAKAMATLYQKSIFYGHTHDTNSFSAVSPIDFKEVRVAQSLGCLCDLNPLWLRNKPNKWVHAFGMFWLKDNGEFQMDIKHVIRGSTIVNGQVFKG